MTPLFLQAPSGQGAESNTGELHCGHGVPGPSLMEQFTVLAKTIPELLWCPVHSQQLPVDPSAITHTAPEVAGTPQQVQHPNSTHLPQTKHELAPQPTQDTNLPSSRSLRGPYLSMTIPRGSVIALSRKDPMVKAKFSISSWALQEGHLCSEAVLFSCSELPVAFPTQNDRGSSLQCVRMRLAVSQEGGKRKASHAGCHNTLGHTPFTFHFFIIIIKKWRRERKAGEQEPNDLSWEQEKDAQAPRGQVT